MSTFNIFLFISVSYLIAQSNGREFDFPELLGMQEDQNNDLKTQIPLTNSASKFLLEVYNDIAENEKDLDHIRQYLDKGSRQRRALREENFITDFDRMEIENCNNIITFSSKSILNTENNLVPDIPITSDMSIGFNTNDVPYDLQLVHSALRIYQKSSLEKYSKNAGVQNSTISIYERSTNPKELKGELRILTSINTTTTYKGWLEINMTSVLNRWLQQSSIQSGDIHELIVGVTLQLPNDNDDEIKTMEILASDLGLIKPDTTKEIMELQPFLIGYFNGPDWIAKTQNLRIKREANFSTPSPPQLQKTYSSPKTCERHNFTLDFKDLNMHNWVIAPKNFEAFFCSGECNFPLGATTKATNHAIVQTLIHLKKFRQLPKPSCAPTVMGAVSILHYLNEDSVKLSRYPQAVANECGCQ